MMGYNVSLLSKLVATGEVMALGWLFVNVMLTLTGREFTSDLRKMIYILAPAVTLFVVFLVSVFVSNSDAQTLGFDGYGEMKDSYDAGIASPVRWKEMKAQETAKEAIKAAAEKEVTEGISSALSLVRNNLKSPWSADIKASHTSISSDSKIYVCGVVNAKNSFDAYTGYQRFVASAPRYVLFDLGSDGGYFEGQWSQYCV